MQDKYTLSTPIILSHIGKEALLPQDTINWSKNTYLTWLDYKAEPNPGAFDDVSSIIRYRATWRVNSESIENAILFFLEDIHIVTEFLPHLSWVREMCVTPELLNHEQGHFDLAELLRDHITTHIRHSLCQKRYRVEGKNDEQQKQFAKEHSSRIIAAELEHWHIYLESKRSEYNLKTNFGNDHTVQSTFDKQFAQLRI